MGSVSVGRLRRGWKHRRFRWTQARSSSPAGDCLLDIEGTDLVGLGVKEIASLIQRESGNLVRLEVWRSYNPENRQSDDGIALAGPLPEVAKKLAKAISGTVRALECPVCLESASPPVSQCVHGHILCVGCRAKTLRCPICRVRLGQGRCLLADQVHKNIREAFDETRDDYSSPNNSSLREKLFGKSNKNSRTGRHGSNDNSRISSTKLKSSITRLFLGGFDKAASAENLSVARLVDENRQTLDPRPAAYRRLGELCQYDRTKSASTGELSKGNDAPRNSSIHRHGTSRVYTSASGLLSVPQTPTWGGSTESINNSSFACPLSRWTSCKEFVSTNFVLEHLARSHDGAQVYFNGKIATIPLPLPFGPESSYILRHQGEIFFFQYENEEAWVAGSCTENLGQWSMLGKNNDGTEVNLRRMVARLEDTSAPLPCHSAPLPKALGIDSITIELLDARLGDALEV
ncbi:uncharacterized protein [Venturia canescens]|uniref:uncharacterized protein isoform X2 n=1 Tax=Venturia canescens TaxID=32260 RepID=UPI001C9CBE50|nr:uncharacterized protein LOC122407923 isoform X2 [Venturia canescens]